MRYFRLLILLNFAGVAPTAMAEESVMTSCLQMASRVQVGITRDEVKTLVGEPIGLSSPREGTYIVGHCSDPVSFKRVLLNIKFTVSEKKTNSNEPYGAASDVVSEVSKPLIALAPSD